MLYPYLLGLLIFSLVVNTLQMLFIDEGKYVSANDRVKSAGTAALMDIGLIVALVLWY